MDTYEKNSFALKKFISFVKKNKLYIKINKILSIWDDIENKKIIKSLLKKFLYKDFYKSYSEIEKLYIDNLSLISPGLINIDVTIYKKFELIKYDNRSFIFEADQVNGLKIKKVIIKSFLSIFEIDEISPEFVENKISIELL